MTRKRRYLIVAGILAGCVCAALGVVAMLPPQPGVTKANFDRVEEGMTLAEVEAILGERKRQSITGGSPQHFRWYHADGTQITIENSQSDWAAGRKHFLESTETIPDKLRRWLHLPK
jgi:hypothetical protein